MPFHKLSQWLTYSLLEPIEAAGVEVVEIDALTALPEYRNGGLLIDHGVIWPRRTIDPAEAFEVGSELIVEWRALTVTLMDQLLAPVRARLGLGDAFKLPHLLQGGTWSAGRKIARTLRLPDGPPPIAVAADGTVFGDCLRYCFRVSRTRSSWSRAQPSLRRLRKLACDAASG